MTNYKVIIGNLRHELECERAWRKKLENQIKETCTKAENLHISGVSLSLPDLEKEMMMYGEFINQCINEKERPMVYPEIKTAAKVWMETRSRFSIDNEA